MWRSEFLRKLNRKKLSNSTCWEYPPTTCSFPNPLGWSLTDCRRPAHPRSDRLGNRRLDEKARPALSSDDLIQLHISQGSSGLCGAVLQHQYTGLRRDPTQAGPGSCGRSCAVDRRGLSLWGLRPSSAARCPKFPLNMLQELTFRVACTSQWT